ncbi:MAG: MmcQ/YjbR family DNA-binding protein [Candidatus Acidiferrum sp.]|jgi:predicted DNA-binding protein (MmcQ/YjbR family)
MNIDQLRKLCLSFPGTTEQTVWEGDLTFKVANKMFAHTVLEVAPVWLSFKSSPENFAELTERQGIIPAPYLARAQWVALETRDALSIDELTCLLRESYDMVVAKLPKKTRELIAQGGALKPKAPSRRRARKKPAKDRKR